MSSIIKVNTIQDAGGNAIITSDGSGVITPNAEGIKNTPAFLATVGSQFGVAHATTTTVRFDSELKDTNSAYDTSAYTFTVPSGEGGTYYIFGNINVHDFTTTDTKRVIIKIMNGSNSIGTFGEHQAANDGSAGHRNNFNVIANLSAGDIIKITLYQNSGSTYQLLADQADNLFGGYKLIGV